MFLINTSIKNKLKKKKIEKAAVKTDRKIWLAYLLSKPLVLYQITPNTDARMDALYGKLLCVSLEK